MQVVNPIQSLNPQQISQFLSPEESQYAYKKIRRLHHRLQCLRGSVQLLRRFLPAGERRGLDGGMHRAGHGLRPGLCDGISSHGP